MKSRVWCKKGLFLSDSRDAWWDFHDADWNSSAELNVQSVSTVNAKVKRSNRVSTKCTVTILVEYSSFQLSSVFTTALWSKTWRPDPHGPDASPQLWLNIHSCYVWFVSYSSGLVGSELQRSSSSSSRCAPLLSSLPTMDKLHTATWRWREGAENFVFWWKSHCCGCRFISCKGACNLCFHNQSEEAAERVTYHSVKSGSPIKLKPPGVTPSTEFWTRRIDTWGLINALLRRMAEEQEDELPVCSWATGGRIEDESPLSDSVAPPSVWAAGMNRRRTNQSL